MCSQAQPEKKACDNRCGRAGGCKKSQAGTRLIVAACSGSICALTKDGEQLDVSREAMPVFSSPQSFIDYLYEKEGNNAMHQLVLVGSRNDIAWINAILPTEMNGNVVAEITYPLCGDWFQEPGLGQLKAAISPMMQ